MTMTNEERMLRQMEEQGLIRPQDLEAHGITGVQRARLAAERMDLRQARDVSVAARHAPTAEHTLAPGASTCLRAQFADRGPG